MKALLILSLISLNCWAFDEDQIEKVCLKKMSKDVKMSQTKISKILVKCSLMFLKGERYWIYASYDHIKEHHPEDSGSSFGRANGILDYNQCVEVTALKEEYLKKCIDRVHLKLSK